MWASENRTVARDSITASEFGAVKLMKRPALIAAEAEPETPSDDTN